MSHIGTVDVEVYDKKDEWQQATFLVHGYGDVLWTDDAEEAAQFILESIKKMEQDAIGDNKEK